MNVKKITGLVAAPFTPMNADGSIALSVIPQYYQRLKQNGVAGAFICGSTGEGVSLTLSEKKAITDVWGACTVDDANFTVMVLLGGTCLADCRELALHAQKAGLDAVSFTAPGYFKPSNVSMLAACCAEVAAAVPDMPFYYYHIPALTGVNIPMYDLLREADGHIPNFAGIKYTHEDFMDFLLCLRYQSGKYDMLWGRDENMLSALALGTRGAVGSTYNYVPAMYHALMNAFHTGKLEEAAALQELSVNIIQLLGKYGGIATGKAYMKLAGLDCGHFRLPVKNMTAESFEKFRSEVNALNIGNYLLK